MKPIRDQVVVVFGASSGIGRLAALQFAERGAKVVAAARDEAGLHSLVNEIIARGGEATAIVADASDFEQVQAVADRTAFKYGRLDTWVQLAGVAVYATFLETTPEEFERVIHVNLLGQAYGAKAALPHLLSKQQGGTFIAVSSVEAMRPLPYHSAYAASKHGVHGFVQTLRMEIEHEKLPIQITEIMPASIDTPFFDKARTKLGVRPQGLPPIYAPEKVVGAILYAAENPAREIVVGGAGKVMLLSQRISPRLTEKMLEKVGFAGQKTSIPREADAPDNLFTPVYGYDQVHGTISMDTGALAGQAREESRRQMPAFSWTATALLAGTAAVAAAAIWAGRPHGNGSHNFKASTVSRPLPVSLEGTQEASTTGTPPVA